MLSCGPHARARLIAGFVFLASFAAPAFAESEDLMGGAFEPQGEVSESAPPAETGPVPLRTATAEPAQSSGSAAPMSGVAVPSRAPRLRDTSPFFSRRIGMGDYCLDAQGGLRAPWEERVPAMILWPCDGLENQAAALVDGALIFGWRFEHYARPAIAPEVGCVAIPAHSQQQTYEFRLCAGEGQFSVDSSDPEKTVIWAFAPPGQPAFVRGAPLYVDLVDAAQNAPPSRFAYNRDVNMISTADGTLCAMPPPGDLSTDAPIYLDLCRGPAQISERDAGRGQIRFLQN